MPDARLFLGLDLEGHTLRVVALDSRCDLALRAWFPLPEFDDVDLDFGPAAPIVQCIEAFLRAHGAQAVLGAQGRPGLLSAFIHRLRAPVRQLAPGEMSRTALESGEGDAQADLFLDAMKLALLGALAATDPSHAVDFGDGA